MDSRKLLCTIQLGSISSLRCQKSRSRTSRSVVTCETDVSRTIDAIDASVVDRQFHLVEPDGIEPTTSCLQSTRSPS